MILQNYLIFISNAWFKGKFILGTIEHMTKDVVYVKTEADEILKKSKGKEDKVKKIVHISDVHIRRNSPERDIEFRQVFNNLDKELKKLKLNEKDSVIVLTGDIFDESDSSGNSSNLFIEFYKMLSNHTNTITIPGNHDQSETLENNISALAKVSESNYKNYVLTQRGQYLYQNVLFSYTDQADAEVYVPISKDENLTKISLYHGMVEHEGLKIFLKLEKNLKLEDFEKYHDWCLFGDIHKQIFMSKKSWYPGSLLQQRVLESFEKGFIYLDLEKKKPKFVRVKNNYGMMKVKIDKESKVYGYDDKYEYPKNLRLEIVNKSGDPKKAEIMEETIRKKYNVTKCVVSNDTDVNLGVELIYDGKKTDVTDIKTKEAIYKLLYGEIKKNNELDKDTDKELQNALKDICTVQEKDTTLKNIILHKLIFKDLMGYSSGSIDFTKFKGIVQLSDLNNAGKTSVWQAIIFSIFGRITKTKDKSNVVRWGITTYYTEIEFTVNKTKYKIIRDGRIDNSKAEFKKVAVKEECSIYENGKNISEDTLPKNNRKIEQLLCSYSDFLKLTILNAKSLSFLDLEDKDRLALLKSMGGLDVLTNIGKKANSLKGSMGQSKNPLNNLMKRFKDHGKDYDEIIASLNNTLKDRNSKLKKIKQELEKHTKNIKKTEKDLLIRQGEMKELMKKGVEEINLKEVTKEKRERNKSLQKIKKEVSKLQVSLMNYNNIFIEKNKFDEGRKQKLDELNNILNEISKEIVNNKDNKDFLKKEIDRLNKSLKKEVNLKNKIVLKKPKGTELTINKKYMKYQDKIRELEKKEFEINIFKDRLTELDEDLKEYEDHGYDPNCKFCVKNNSKKFNLEKKRDKCQKDLNNKHKDLDKILKWRDNNKKSLKDKEDLDKYLENKSRSDELNKEIEELEIKLEEYKNRLEKLDEDTKKDNELLKEHKKVLDEIKNLPNFDKYEKYSRLKDDLMSKKDIKVKLENEIKVLSDKVNNYLDNKENLNRVKTLTKEIDEIFGTLKEENKKEVKLLEEKDELISLKTETTSNLEEIKAGKKEYDEINKKGFIYKVIEDCINNKHFIRDILETKVLPKLEKLVNSFVKDLDLDPIKIVIDGKDGGKFVNIYDMATKKLKVMSGRYENHIFNIIFSICMNKLNKSIKPEFLIIDEALDSTHTKNVPKVLDLISKLQNTGNYKFILLISHQEDIKKYSDKKLKIKRLEDGSRSINC